VRERERERETLRPEGKGKSQGRARAREGPREGGRVTGYCRQEVDWRPQRLQGISQQRAPTYTLRDLYRDFLRFRFCPFPFPRTDVLENKITETDRERTRGTGEQRRQWGHRPNRSASWSWWLGHMNVLGQHAPHSSFFLTLPTLGCQPQPLARP
jgi:hypothetical protein